MVHGPCVNWTITFLQLLNSLILKKWSMDCVLTWDIVWLVCDWPTCNLWLWWKGELTLCSTEHKGQKQLNFWLGWNGHGSCAQLRPSERYNQLNSWVEWNGDLPMCSLRDGIDVHFLPYMQMSSRIKIIVKIADKSLAPRIISCTNYFPPAVIPLYVIVFTEWRASFHGLTVSQLCFLTDKVVPIVFLGEEGLQVLVTLFFSTQLV